MSNARYLEIDSTYRNRNQYPFAADFVVPLSMSGTKGNLDAVDPVSNSAIETVWQSNRFTIGPAPGLTLAGNVASMTPIAATTGSVIVIMETVSGLVQHLPNYYAASVLVDTTPLSTIRVRITSSEFMGTVNGHDRIRLVLNGTFPVPLTTGIIITDPTDLTSPMDPWLFVPDGKRAPNAYPGTIVHNQSLNESRPVKDYQALTHLIGLDTSGPPGTQHSGPIPGTWSADDIYSIRPKLPSLCDDILNPSFLLTLQGLDTPINPPNKTSFNLNTTLLRTTGMAGKDFTGDFLELGPLAPTAIQIAAGWLSGTLAGGFPTTTTFLINSGNAVPVDDYYVGCTITIVQNSTGAVLPQGESQVITAYDGVAAPQRVTVSPGFSLPPGNTSRFRIDWPQEARRIVKYADFRGTADPGGSTTIIQFPVGASNVPNFYERLYIRFPGFPSNLRLITSYTITKNANNQIVLRTATVSSPFSFNTSNLQFTITSGIVRPAFSNTIGPGAAPLGGGQVVPWLAPTMNNHQGACILPFSHDNLSPFVYSGSLTSQQSMVCYEIELLNLVLPNAELAIAGGGNIAYYPYVYVQLQNISASGAGLKNIIYSNNPNATNMLFRAAIDDVPNPLNSSFIKIDGDGAVQTIKFRPNDNLRFSVRMADGEVFQTILPEFVSPSFPNPLAQISAYFSIKRL